MAKLLVLDEILRFKLLENSCLSNGLLTTIESHNKAGVQGLVSWGGGIAGKTLGIPMIVVKKIYIYIYSTSKHSVVSGCNGVTRDLLYSRAMFHTITPSWKSKTF